MTAKPVARTLHRQSLAPPDQAARQPVAPAARGSAPEPLQSTHGSPEQGPFDAGAVGEAWRPLLGDLFETTEWEQLQAFLETERRQHRIWPEPELVFEAFRRTPPPAVRLVLLGQDPYHGPGQAHGLSFSVREGQRLPPSLRNIFRELHTDLGYAPVTSGDLTPWAGSGVLLLNSLLTVREGEPLSHRRAGWEWFTDQVIERVSRLGHPVVFVLWGAAARAKRSLVAADQLVLESAHPSPLSVRHGFWGSRPFSRANTWLCERGSTPVDWRLDRTD